MSPVDEILSLFEREGDNAYFGEDVTQTQHALQSAQLAESEGAPAALIVAALLHDLGHLLHDLGEDAAERGIDDLHENAGSTWLSRYFGPDVVEPVRLHVEAKRYLCAVDESYAKGLSQASIRSLELQGGPMSSEERAEFEKRLYAQDAIRLRRWDDAAKVAAWRGPGMAHYRDLLESVLNRSEATR
jgi:phosphonate degradation associated HDIG domain protein